MLPFLEELDLVSLHLFSGPKDGSRREANVKRRCDATGGSAAVPERAPPLCRRKLPLHPGACFSTCLLKDDSWTCSIKETLPDTGYKIKYLPCALCASGLAAFDPGQMLSYLFQITCMHDPPGQPRAWSMQSKILGFRPHHSYIHTIV